MKEQVGAKRNTHDLPKEIRLSVITANPPYKTNTSSTKTQAFKGCQFKRHLA